MRSFSTVLIVYISPWLSCVFHLLCGELSPLMLICHFLAVFLSIPLFFPEFREFSSRFVRATADFSTNKMPSNYSSHINTQLLRKNRSCVILRASVGLYNACLHFQFFSRSNFKFFRFFRAFQKLSLVKSAQSVGS